MIVKKSFNYEDVLFGCSYSCCNCPYPPLAQAYNKFNPYGIYNGQGVTLFKNHAEVNSETGFRIPAIAAGNGVLVAATDIRYHGGGKDLASNDNGINLYKTHLGTKISFDKGQTWTDLAPHLSSDNVGANDFMGFATDPAVVYDTERDNILMFGFRTNVQIVEGGVGKNPMQDIQNIPADQHTRLIMFKSGDRGNTWETKDITSDILDKINIANAGGTKKYTLVLQGPGGGMTYKGKIYVPIQTWATKKNINDNNKFVGTSGFMVSADGGETWEVSKMLIPNVDNKLAGKDTMSNSSESNVFYHKGAIHLAVRNEQKTTQYPKGRLCFKYVQDGAGEWNWQEVLEPFIPDDVAQIETSSHSLSEDVYLVSYAMNPNRSGRYIATNTGIKMVIQEGVSKSGYTSLTSDDENIYILYEEVINDNFSLGFKAIDWKHKDYAVLNTQIRNRAFMLNEIQDKFSSADSYVSGSFGDDDVYADLVKSSNGLKGGIFFRNHKNVEEDNTSVSEYDNYDITFLVGADRDILKGAAKGTAMLGYMNSAIDYANGSENDVHSLVAGYRFDYKGKYFGVRSGINYIYSRNELQRNKNEGLGKTAEFDSQSISLSNEIYKGFEFGEYGDVELAAGMVNTLFKHDGFREEGGEGTDENGMHGANNARFENCSLQSHEVYVKAGWDSKAYSVADFAKLSLSTDLKYAIDLADVDKWKEDYRSFSVDRTYDDIGELYSGRDNGFFSAELGANLSILDEIDVSVKGVADSRGEYSARVEGRISI